MNYNAIIPPIVDVTDESGATSEPVTIQEFKNYMRLEGFVDEYASTTEALSDFDFDDLLIAELITMSRRIIEKNTYDNLIIKTLQVTATNLCGRLRLPGPVRTTPTMTIVDKNGTAVDASNIKMSGDFLVTPLLEDMIITYSAGHTHCPKRLKIEVMRIAAFFYVNRGEDDRRQFVASLPSKILA